MKLNPLSVVIGVTLLPSFGALAQSIEQTLTFTPDNCAPGWYCQYKATADDEGGLDVNHLSSYAMSFRSKPQVNGVTVGDSVWSEGVNVVTGVDAAGQAATIWPTFNADVVFDGEPNSGGPDEGGNNGGDSNGGALPTENAIIHHVTFPYNDAQTTIDVFHLGTDYANDVVLSNLIAGSLYSYLVEKKYPEVNFNQEYLVGSILSQLLQEAGLSDTRINPDYDPSATKQSIHEPGYASQLLAVGQGGPYQINDYSKRLPDKSTPGALGLINYNALHASLGYSIDDQDNDIQSGAIGPDSLEDIYFGPIAATYFQFNDINRLEVLASQSWYQNQEAWNTCFNTALKDESFTQDPNALRLTDFLINVIYNAGSYSTAFGDYLDVCVDAYSNGVTTELPYLNSYDLGPEEYKQSISATAEEWWYRYPRQVSFYVDQLFGQDLIEHGLNMSNHEQFTVAEIRPVFVKAFTQISYKPTDESAPVFIDDSTAAQAFDQAMSEAGVTEATSYALSDKQGRAALFDFLYTVFTQVESRTAPLDAVSGEVTSEGGDGGDGGVTPPPSGEWSESAIYETPCMTVTLDGQEYQNQWWTQGDRPDPNSGDGYSSSVWRFPSSASNNCP
ncbi:hypothetical protein ACODM8_12480 [Vibrio ostreicida]|uniref:Chitin-binding type-3 domain-containing protein n=1 Tax=Vibrio ostreicida TaxID=526588 RepID=A0ABT8C216_9VIBR|nr:hypothetical protein [Vibrio ostreicida]MDN3612382.1 hypothetical protein [Vibrio ostreicida]NPD09847.1 hypothetical protein [Vibrio ostreicida]